MFISVRPRTLPLMIPLIGALAACGSEPLGVVSVVVTPSVDTLIAVGATRQLSATATDANGSALLGKTFQWRSSAPTVVTIDPVTGLATGVASGKAIITATADGISGSATLIMQLPAQLAFVVQPGNSTAGLAMSPGVQVEVQDASGNRVTRAADPITIAIAANAGGGTLSGSRTISAVAGRTTFSDLSIEKAGGAYTLEASAPLLGSITSRPFDVAPGAPNRVVFVNQPPRDIEGNVVISPPIEVEVQDAFGNVRQGDHVVMSLGTNPWAGPTAPGGRLIGDPQTNVINGVASFANLRVDKPARGYVLRATVGAVAGVSAPFHVSLTFSSLDAGDLNACGVAAGATYCWGGVAVFDSVPELVGSGLGFVEISAGRFHTCGRTGVGAVYCWGLNSSGQLGNGNAMDSGTPVAVTGGLTFTSVSAGGFHTCGLTNTQRVYCWGSGLDGQLGNGTNVSSTTPVLVVGNLMFTSVAVGILHACGITTSNAVYCWGFNGGGELGDPSIPIGGTSNVPVLVQGGLTFLSLSAGHFFNCGVTTGGAAYCWGNGGGGLGNGSDLASSTPVAVAGGMSFTSVSAGAEHACGTITTSPGLACWGRNGSGEVGDGTTTNSNSPVLINLGTAVSGVSAGEKHTCARTASGLMCWGSNDMGQLGNGTRVGSLTAVTVVQ